MNDKQLMRIIRYCQQAAKDEIERVVLSAGFVAGASIRYDVAFPSCYFMCVRISPVGQDIEKSKPFLWRLSIGKTTATWKGIFDYTLYGGLAIIGIPREIQVDISSVLENNESEPKDAL